MEPGKTYHLYTHAIGFENLFKSDENYRYFLEKYELFVPSVHEPTFLKRDEVISWFGNKAEFLKFHQQPVAPRMIQEFDL
jgi:hypothetical protein